MPALDLIIAAIERVAKLREFCQIAGHGVLDKLVWRAPSGGGKLLKTRFGFGLEMNYHRSEFRGTQLGLSKRFWDNYRATRFLGRHNIFKKLGIHDRISLPEFVKPAGASELESTGSVCKTA